MPAPDEELPRPDASADEPPPEASAESPAGASADESPVGASAEEPATDPAREAALARLREGLATLEEAGARVFDVASVTFVEGLLRRAASVPEAAAVRLLQAAETRLGRLAGELAAARSEAEATVRELEAGGFDPEVAETALSRGDLVALRRAESRRRAGGAVPPGRTVVRALPLTPTVETRRSGWRRPAPAAAAPPKRRRESAAAARAHHQRTFAELGTALTLERSLSSLPEAAGPYNGQTAAARILQRAAELSPVYAHAQLERLRDLAALALLPQPPAPPRRR